MGKKKINALLIALEIAVVAALVAVLVIVGLKKAPDDLKLSDITDAVIPDGFSEGKAGDAMDLKKYYGLAATDYEDFCLYLPASNMDAAELLIVVCKDEAQTEAVTDAAEERLAQEKSVFESYGVDQMKLLNSAHIMSSGRYVCFVVSKNGDDIADKFEALAGNTYLSTNEGGETVETNILSTLSTSVAENVDKTEAETTEVWTETETETEIFVETTTEGSKNELLTDAGYYYTYYSAVFMIYGGGLQEEYSDEAFKKVYMSIKNETLADYFTSEGWVQREGGNSLELYPTDKLLPRGNSSAMKWMARCINAFGLLKKAHEGDSEWDNPDSLKPQFHCHVLYAGSIKTPWNIESYRTETDFEKVVAAEGNP